MCINHRKTLTKNIMFCIDISIKNRITRQNLDTSYWILLFWSLINVNIVELKKKKKHC